MNPEQYTTGDILEAMQKAGLIGTVYDFRQFLNHLPEPVTDDWQECTFEEIQKGDRVKRVVKSSDGITSTIEGVATHHHLTGWGTELHYLAPEDDGEYGEHVTLYRIPARVTHPDPAEHPVIIDSGEAWFWNPHQEMYQQAGTAEYRFPEGFTNWGAAEVITTEPAEVPHDR